MWSIEQIYKSRSSRAKPRRERRTSLAGGDLDCRETAYILVFFASFNTSSGAEGFNSLGTRWLRRDSLLIGRIGSPSEALPCMS